MQNILTLWIPYIKMTIIRENSRLACRWALIYYILDTGATGIKYNQVLVWWLWFHSCECQFFMLHNIALVLLVQLAEICCKIRIQMNVSCKTEMSVNTLKHFYFNFSWMGEKLQATVGKLLQTTQSFKTVFFTAKTKTILQFINFSCSDSYWGLEICHLPGLPKQQIKYNK